MTSSLSCQWKGRQLCIKILSWPSSAFWFKLWVSLLGEGVHVFGESVDYGLQKTTLGSNPDSSLVMWTRVGLRHFSETVSPYVKWNGHYLPCSKSSDCWRWTGEVPGRHLAWRRHWQSSSCFPKCTSSLVLNLVSRIIFSLSKTRAAHVCGRGHSEGFYFLI